MGILIRRARVGDEQLLARLNGLAQAIHVAARPDHFKPTGAAELAGWYLSLLQEPAARVWIAEADGAAVGYLVAIFRSVPANPFCRPRRWCEIDQVAVEPAWRRRGIARELVRTAAVEARDEGMRTVELTSWSFNERAQETFRRLGFRPKIVRFELDLPDS